jgi:hypothetical protein
MEATAADATRQREGKAGGCRKDLQTHGLGFQKR